MKTITSGTGPLEIIQLSLSPEDARLLDEWRGDLSRELFMLSVLRIVTSRRVTEPPPWIPENNRELAETKAEVRRLRLRIENATLLLRLEMLSSGKLSDVRSTVIGGEKAKPASAGTDSERLSN